MPPFATRQRNVITFAIEYDLPHNVVIVGEHNKRIVFVPIGHTANRFNANNFKRCAIVGFERLRIGLCGYEYGAREKSQDAPTS